jgi:hypothetical protein
MAAMAAGTLIRPSSLRGSLCRFFLFLFPSLCLFLCLFLRLSLALFLGGKGQAYRLHEHHVFKFLEAATPALAATAP